MRAVDMVKRLKQLVCKIVRLILPVGRRAGNRDVVNTEFPHLVHQGKDYIVLVKDIAAAAGGENKREHILIKSSDAVNAVPQAVEPHKLRSLEECHGRILGNGAAVCGDLRKLVGAHAVLLRRCRFLRVIRVYSHPRRKAFENDLKRTVKVRLVTVVRLRRAFFHIAKSFAYSVRKEAAVIRHGVSLICARSPKHSDLVEVLFTEKFPFTVSDMAVSHRSHHFAELLHAFLQIFHGLISVCLIFGYVGMRLDPPCKVQKSRLGLGSPMIISPSCITGSVQSHESTIACARHTTYGSVSECFSNASRNGVLHSLSKGV